MSISAAEVLHLYHDLEGAGAPFWLDGGWGVDALLGVQSREHCDLDIVIEERHVAIALDRLSRLGFQNYATQDQRDWNFVWAHPDGRVVDFHVIVFDDVGNGIYGPASNGEAYLADSFSGAGEITGISVRCLSADYQLRSHDSGYDLAEKDVADMRALCVAFDMILPPRFH